jgi:hypothetical protein
MNREIRPTEFEKAVMEMILEEEIPEKRILQEQWQQARITKRSFSGAGFFLNFNVPDTVPKTIRLNFEANSGDTMVAALLPELKHGMNFILFIREGKLSMLEGFTYEDWPSASGFKLERVKLNHPQEKRMVPPEA